MLVLINNNAGSKLGAAIDSSQTSLTVTTGTGLLFPSPITPAYFYATIAEGTKLEIVKVTARSGDSFTVIRAQDGTTGQAFTIAAKFEQRWNRAQVAETIQDYSMPKVYSIPNGVNLISISFATARPDSNYSVSFGIECNDSNPIFLNGIIQNKTVNGFDIILNAPTDSANYKLNYKVGNAV